MFLINGSIKCSDIDYGTNTFFIYHNFGFVKSATKSFSFEYENTIEQFRPAYVTFGDGFIKVSIGTYRFNQLGVINYSFVAMNIEELKTLGISQELYARLKVVEESILYAKMRVKQVVPGDVVIKSDIEFNVIQGNVQPNFYWDTPVRNSDASNSSSANDTEVSIVGYYYAFNKNENYFITKSDSYIKETSNSNSTNVYVRFPTSGTYYFHIRAVNSVGEVSRNTSHAKVIYNNPPTTPSDLKVNGYEYYLGSANINLFSWNSSTNTDGDEIDYEISIYKNNELFYNDYITALRCQESFLYGQMSITANYLMAGKMNVQLKRGSILYGRIYVVEDSNSYSDSFSYVYSTGSNSYSHSLSQSYSSVNENGEFVFKDIMSKRREPGKLYYIYDKKIQNNRAGNYHYMLRAYDWAEQSTWSNICYYDIVDKHIDFYSKMWIGYNFEENFGMSPFFGKMFIKGDTWFFGCMYIIPKLIGKVIVCNLCTTAQPLYAIIRFKYYDTLYGKINIDTNFSDIYGKLNISCIPYTSILFSKMRIVTEGQSSFGFDVIFRNFQYVGFHGGMFIIANGTDCFYALVEIIKERMSAKMDIFRNFSLDNNYNDGKLMCKMMVDNYPPEPKITCTVGHDWQNESVVTFFWTIEESNIKVIAYEYFLSPTPIIDFSNVSFIRTVSSERTLNLYNYNMDSEYYFYVRSVGANGSYSNASVYQVKYNNIPTVPSYPMYVNEKECISEIPVVSKSEYNEFSWPKSEHQDMDVVKYNIQISNRSDFSNIIIDIDEIYNIDFDSFISVKIKHDYNIDNPIYYWRVRAYDRHQYTDYGHTGRFKCNTKPGVPTNLSVSNEV